MLNALNHDTLKNYDTLNAPKLRRLAMQYATRAIDDDCAEEERDRLLRMREALLSLATNADWLAGKPISIIPPQPL